MYEHNFHADDSLFQKGPTENYKVTQKPICVLSKTTIPSQSLKKKLQPVPETQLPDQLESKKAIPFQFARDVDVLLGRGKRTTNHPGNIFFRELITKIAPIYKDSTKVQKTALSECIVAAIKKEGGRFLSPMSDNLDLLCEINGVALRTKTCQAIRDCKGYSINVSPTDSLSKKSGNNSKKPVKKSIKKSLASNKEQPDDISILPVYKSNLVVKEMKEMKVNNFEMYEDYFHADDSLFQKGPTENYKVTQKPMSILSHTTIPSQSLKKKLRPVPETQLPDQLESKKAIPFQFARDVDVLLGRGKRTTYHPGNIYFRALVSKIATKYKESGKTEKTALAESIVAAIKKEGGRFLCPIANEVGLLYEINGTVLRTKASQAIRDFLVINKINKL